jgi:hypothetical protein
MWEAFDSEEQVALYGFMGYNPCQNSDMQHATHHIFIICLCIIYLKICLMNMPHADLTN